MAEMMAMTQMMHGGPMGGPRQQPGGFGFIPLFHEDFEDDLPEEEPAIEVIRTVQEASDKREKQAKAPFAAGSVFKESEPIPDDHALEVVVEADDANTSLGQTKKTE